MIRSYLSDVINDHKTPINLKIHWHDAVINYKIQFAEWKIQLTMQISFTSSKDFEGTCTMHTKNDNVEIMKGSERNDIITELFKSIFKRYQEGLGESVRGSEFVFNNVDLLYYHIHCIR